MKNSFLKKKPSRAKYWDSTKNNIQPSEVSYGSNKKFWFKCENNHSFQESPKIMTYRQQICNECSFQSNRLDITYPELIEEWDKTKNTTSPAMHTLDRGIEKLRNGEDISFKEISDISKGFNQMYFKDVPYRDENPAYLAIKNYCRDFGVDANELATLAMRFLEDEYKNKKKSA